MEVVTEEIVILARTTMAGGVCVGAYDTNNNNMIRLFDENGQNLMSHAPYRVGDIYSGKYKFKRSLAYPHVEDVIVIEAAYEGSVFENERFERTFNTLIDSLAYKDLNPSDLFDGKLVWERSAFVEIDNRPTYSVMIASLDRDLHKDGDYFIWTEFYDVYRVKYVGTKPIEQLPATINAGMFIRLSLARFWDKDKDGVKRSYLQLSWVY
ncbi:MULTISPECIES: hypothetical protein [unclassified Cobetia]|uniref:dual OB domain-containing protein n=1 Tax=unclassified Cobetia TaxID=2609414 RepID=UPI002096832D|nr:MULTISPECIES: hypothetical protein [unclassified Cobetia]MCO7231364.1 hypothetical protein [Cobetia sp. Dlab-2-AX]MCO7234227.1 hypothetical protein [Cobetia sp. Dlab-2-U]